MKRKPRGPFKEDHYYHIVNRGNNKNPIFKYPEDKDFFQDRIFLYTPKYFIHPIRFCTMNNHFHIMLFINKYSKVPEFMQALCTSYAMYYNKKYSHVGHVFQNRYRSKLIKTKTGILNVFEYIRQNPVKEGYCNIPENYPWLWTAGTDLGKDRPLSRYPHVPLPPNFPKEIS